MTTPTSPESGLFIGLGTLSALFLSIGRDLTGARLTSLAAQTNASREIECVKGGFRHSIQAC
jgi:hypothetical protein